MKKVLCCILVVGAILAAAFIGKEYLADDVKNKDSDTTETASGESSTENSIEDSETSTETSTED